MILPLLISPEVDFRAFPLGELYPHLGFASRQALGVTTCRILAAACEPHVDHVVGSQDLLGEIQKEQDVDAALPLSVRTCGSWVKPAEMLG